MSEKVNVDWRMLTALASVMVLLVVVSVQWQQAESDIGSLTREIIQIEETHDADIARLDESMRTRRNQIADLEERIAVLEERTSG